MEEQALRKAARECNISYEDGIELVLVGAGVCPALRHPASLASGPDRFNNRFKLGLRSCDTDGFRVFYKERQGIHRLVSCERSPCIPDTVLQITNTLQLQFHIPSGSDVELCEHARDAATKANTVLSFMSKRKIEAEVCYVLETLDEYHTESASQGLTTTALAVSSQSSSTSSTDGAHNAHSLRKEQAIPTRPSIGKARNYCETMVFPDSDAREWLISSLVPWSQERIL